MYIDGKRNNSGAVTIITIGCLYLEDPGNMHRIAAGKYTDLECQGP